VRAYGSAKSECYGCAEQQEALPAWDEAEMKVHTFEARRRGG
jgi:hypothetical protein